jgi:hypothetical protein
MVIYLVTIVARYHDNFRVFENSFHFGRFHSQIRRVLITFPKEILLLYPFTKILFFEKKIKIKKCNISENNLFCVETVVFFFFFFFQL